MKHKVVIQVKKPNGTNKTILKGAQRKLPERIIRWIFGEYRQIYLLDTGASVQSVDIHELKKGAEDERTEKQTTRSTCDCRKDGR